MKKIIYFLAIAAVTAFSACKKPLDSDYKELGPINPVVKIVPAPTIASVTLGAADYALLSPSIPANTQHFFISTADAFANIPAILAKNYATAADKSQVTVTYATSPLVPTLKLADSLNADVAYTLKTTPTSDYVYPKFGNFAASNFNDFTATAVLGYLYYTNQTALPDNSIKVLTYAYFESGATPSTGTTKTDAFLYTAANGWQKIYAVTPAQYTSVNRGTNNWFLASDVAVNTTLPSYFNTFLKTDPTVMSSIHVGDVIYVSYRYLTTYQRVMPMTFDGNNFVVSNTSATNLFTLSGGVWTGQLDNTVFYTLATGDYANIATFAADPSIGLTSSNTAVINLIGSKDFTLNSNTATSRWSDKQISNGLILGVLKPIYTAPSVNQKFVITFKTYSQYPNETYIFIYDGTNFVYQPAPDKTKYTLTGDDYAAIGGDATTGATSAAMTNLVSFGDFALTGTSAWQQAQINIGIVDVLKTRYPTAAAGQTTVVTYAIYNGANVLTSTTFKFDGTNWAGQ